MNVTLVGHVTRDRLVRPGEPEHALPGGCVRYAASVYIALGWEVSVVTAGRPIDGFPRDTRVQAQASRMTTAFVNRYVGDVRNQEIEALGPPLTPPDVVPRPSPDLLHLAPVLGEVDLRAWAPHGRFVGVGLQGWLRRPERAPGPGVRVVPGAPPPLEGVNAVALSDADLQGHTGLLEHLRQSVPFVALTRGRRGATVYEGERAREVDAHEADEVDPTGAGDTFAAAWFAGLAEGMDARDAGVRASRFAASCVGVLGVPSAIALQRRVAKSRARADGAGRGSS